MTNLPDATPAGRLERPSGLGRWLTTDERAQLTKPQASRLALERAVGPSEALPYVQGWLDETHSANTRNDYALDMLTFVDWLRDRHGNPDAPLDLTKVGRKVIAGYAAHMRENVSERTKRTLSPATQARRLSSLSSLYDYMTEVDAIEFNPAHNMRRPRVSRKGKTRSVPVDQVNAMLDAARAAAPEHRMRDLALLALLYTSGVRITEVTRADVPDLFHDGQSGRRLLRITLKGGEEEYRAVDPGACHVIDAYLDGRTDGPLILANDGDRLNRDQATRILRRLARAADVTDPEKIRPHRMRASWITQALKKGEIQDVQEAAGHKDPGTTMRYRDQHGRLERQAALTAAVASEVDLSLPENGDEQGRGTHVSAAIDPS